MRWRKIFMLIQVSVTIYKGSVFDQSVERLTNLYWKRGHETFIDYRTRRKQMLNEID